MKIKEEFIWIGIGTFMIVFLAIFVITPALVAQPTGKETDQYIKMLEEAFHFVENNYVDQVPPKQLFEGAMKGLFDSLDDPYSYYLTATDMEELNDTTTGKFGGVGLYISKEAPTLGLPAEEQPQNSNAANSAHAPEQSPYVRVVAPIEDTPAFRAGIAPGDYITKIEDESTEKMTIDEVVNRLRGKPGTKVEVTILRDKDIVFKVVIKREIIEVPTVKFAMIDGGIGYLKIIQFTPYTAERVRDAIDFFKKNRYKSLIIDVRRNPGGLLNSVVKIADYFLDKGLIVSTKSRIKSENAVYRATAKVRVPTDMPIILLIDHSSASASEILAGALEDNNRATLVGETSFGKGSVQRVMEFGDGGIKLTMARYYTPSGINIDKIGINPNIEVKEPEFTEKETEAYKTIIQENLIGDFISKHPDPSEKEITAFEKELKQKKIVLEHRVIRKLIRNEVNKTKRVQPVYDLDYDLVLQKAMEILKK